MNIKKFFYEILAELKQTTFPSRSTVINFTLFVIIFSAIIAAFLSALDLGFGEILLRLITI